MTVRCPTASVKGRKRKRKQPLQRYTCMMHLKMLSFWASNDTVKHIYCSAAFGYFSQVSFLITRVIWLKFCKNVTLFFVFLSYPM